MEPPSMPDNDDGHAARRLTFLSPGIAGPSSGVAAHSPGAAASMAPYGSWESTLEVLGVAANVASFSSKTLAFHSSSMVQVVSQILI
jgi:hypothetical protein